MIKKPLLLGHRGTRVHAPENTIAAFDICLEHGCDGFELDVRRTRDGKIVVVHDADVNGREVATSRFEELQHASAHPIPLLSEVLQHYAETAVINVEMKVVGMGEQIAEMMREHPVKEGVVVSSFLPDAIHEFHAAAPDVLCGFICRDPELLHLWKSLPIHYVVLHGLLVTEELVKEIHEHGKQIWIWTINAEKDCRRALAIAVDGIISDDSLMLGSLLRNA